jgi:glycosyltransferase involved in cell wall biosynthesis
VKIAYATDTFRPEINGVTNTLRYLTAYLDKKDIEYLVFAPAYGEGDGEEKRVVRFKGFRPPVSPESRLAFPRYREVRDALAAFAPDLVHIVTELGIGFAVLRAARELGIPLVMSYHTNFDKYLGAYDSLPLESAYWAYMKWFHGFAEVNLCPSRDTLIELKRRDFPRPDIWSRGVDTCLFSPARYCELTRESLGGKNRTIFLYVGRLSKEKGLDTFAVAAERIGREFGDAVGFVLTGDGPYKKELIDRHIPNMFFTGFRQKEELAAVYASSDIFVFPSGTETFGNVVLEAMGSGLPVICADEGGVTGFTAHRTNAWVFRYRDAEALAAGMRQLLSDESLRSRLRFGALLTAGQRSWDSVLDKLLSQYEGALAARGHARGPAAPQRAPIPKTNSKANRPPPPTRGGGGGRLRSKHGPGD